MISRRKFLGTTVLGGGAAALLPGGLSAQAASAFRFEPDAGWTVAGQPVEIDVALLGPNGEPTSGFMPLWTRSTAGHLALAGTLFIKSCFVMAREVLTPKKLTVS